MNLHQHFLVRNFIPLPFKLHIPPKSILPIHISLHPGSMDDEGPEPKKRKRKGGIQQRLAAAKAENQCPGSLLARFLLVSFSWGKFSPQFVQKVAKLACDDIQNARKYDSDLEDLTVLSKLGSSGTYPNKMHQELMHKVVEPKLPKPFYATVPCAKPWDEQIQGMMLPHEVFSAIYHHYPRAWKQRILPDTTELKQFWAEMQDHPQFENDPMMQRRGWMNRMVPIGLHGDAFPCTGIGKGWTKLMDTWNWTSMLVRGSTLNTVFFIWAVFGNLCLHNQGNVTINVCLKILKWSFLALYNGRWPYKDYNDVPYNENSPEGLKAGHFLADGFCGRLFAIMGDLDYFSKDLGLPQHNKAENPCLRCYCSNTGLVPWSDWRQSARWVRMIWKPSSWRSWSDRSKCPLFDLPGVSALTAMVDYMHCKYLGSDQYMFGSILWIIVYYVLQGSPEDNMAYVWRFIQQYYRLHHVKTRYRYLNKLSMFKRKLDPQS